MYIANTFSVIKPEADNNNLISTIPANILPGKGTAGLARRSNNGKTYVTNFEAQYL